MKKATIAASVFTLLTLAGCASQSQVDEQNKGGTVKNTTTFRTVEADGSRIKLADTGYIENGVRVSCKQSVKAMPDTDGPAIHIEKTCQSSELGATGQADTPSALSKLASKSLQADGITDGRIVEIVEAKSPFIFTYCRKGSSSLWRHEVMSLDAPDAPGASKVVYDRAVESISKICKVAG